MGEWISGRDVPPLTGTEMFSGLDASVLDFWRFALPDLRMNNARGYLAEYLVTRAVGADHPRVEWDAYDVLAPDGTTIEVKASAYLQVWEQRRLSRITFSGLRGSTPVDEPAGTPSKKYKADVYVFCLQTAQTHEAYEPLDVGQWEFYVLSRATVAAADRKSLGLAAVQHLSKGPVAFSGLAAAIGEATEQT